MTLWADRDDYDTMVVPSYNDIKGGTVMTMILWGYSHDYKIMVGPSLMVMTLWGVLKKKTLMGYPFDCDIMWVPSSLWKYIAYPHDYEIMGDP